MCGSCSRPKEKCFASEVPSDSPLLAKAKGKGKGKGKGNADGGKAKGKGKKGADKTHDAKADDGKADSKKVAELWKKLEAAEKKIAEYEEWEEEDEDEDDEEDDEADHDAEVIDCIQDHM